MESCMNKIALTAIALGLAASTCAFAADDAAVFARAKAGDVTAQGGARRIHGDMVEM